MRKLIQKLQRPLYAVAALALLLGVVGPTVLPGFVKAADVTDRAIKISSAIDNASNVTYFVSFTLSATNAANSVVIDFCGDSPLIGYTNCNTTVNLATNNFDVSGATLNAQTGSSGWAIVAADTTATHIEIGGATQAAASTTITLELTGVHNPDLSAAASRTFFARIYTYSAADPVYTSPANPGSYLDAGGIALSTAEAVEITAIVQEKLIFCVSAADLTGTDCTAATTPTLSLGSGTPQVIDDSGPYTGDVYTQISTNAQSGVIVRMKNSNASCTTDGNGEGGAGGMSRDGGTTCSIGPVGSGGGIAGGYAFTAGPSSAEFGMYCTPATANLTAAQPYDGGGSTQFGMDTTTAGDNVITTYGDTIYSSSGAINEENATLTFGAQASLTTPAGVYTASMDLIATGTF